MSKKKAQYKAKRDIMWALLLAIIPKVSALTYTSVLLHELSFAIPRLSTTVPRSSAAILRLSATMLGLPAAMPGLSTIVSRLSITISGLFTPTFASILVPGLSASIPLSVSVSMTDPMLKVSTLILLFPSMLVLRLSSLSTSLHALVPRSSPLPFLALSSLKILTPNLAAKRQKLDDTISRWNERSKKASSEELWSRRIRKAALEEVFLLKAHLFLPLFFSSSIDKKRKLDKTFINTQPLAKNHSKEEIDLSFAGCGFLLVVKLNRL